MTTTTTTMTTRPMATDDAVNCVNMLNESQDAFDGHPFRCALFNHSRHIFKMDKEEARSFVHTRFSSIYYTTCIGGRSLLVFTFGYTMETLEICQ